MYLASWPLGALPLLGLGLGAMLPRVSPYGPMAVITLLLGSLVLAVYCLARLDYNSRRLLVRNTWIGNQPCIWKPGLPLS